MTKEQKIIKILKMYEFGDVLKNGNYITGIKRREFENVAKDLVKLFNLPDSEIMIKDLDREDLEALVKGSYPNYNEFENQLVKKAGHSYSDQYGRTSWNNLSDLNDDELYKLYKICRNSF